MTNAEKFKTVEERIKEFKKFCKGRYCEGCSCKKTTTGYAPIIRCMLTWLDLENKEELKPCPFCGNEAGIIKVTQGCSEYTIVECKKCLCRTIGLSSEAEAIAKWNRRAK